MSQPSTMSFIVDEVITENPSVKTLRLMPEPGMKMFDFLPGQFVMLMPKNSSIKKMRPFSMSSSPSRQDSFEFTVKRAGPYSQALCTAQKGDTFLIRGPMGTFTFQDSMTEDIVFIAGGVGVAVFRCMIRCLTEKKLPHKVSLLCSFRDRESILFEDELKTIKEKHTGFDFHITLTQPKDTDNWNSLTGRIDADMIEKTAGLGENTLYFICGPTDMVNDTFRMLKEQGIRPANIKTERWGSMESIG